MTDPVTLWRNLSATHRNVLRALDKPMSTQQVADMMDIEYQRAAALLYRLHHAGLIQSYQAHSRTALGDQTIDATGPAVVQIPHYGRINSTEDISSGLRSLGFVVPGGVG